MIDKIEKKLIDSALRIVKDGEGCLYVIKLKDFNYEPLVPNDMQPFSIFEDANQKRMDILAKMDGACIINEQGELLAYGMKINNTVAFQGFGTRHSAAYTASLNGNISIMGSEENKKVRIFKNGEMIMQIDALETGIEHKTSQAVGLLESIGIGALGTIGAGLIIPAMAIAIIPGILIFGSSHFLLKHLLNISNGSK